MEEALGLWGRLAEQLPALGLSLAIFAFMGVKGMRFFKDMAQMFATTLRQIGDDCHRHATERQEAMHEELRRSREAMDEFSKAVARDEAIMLRVAAALERAQSP